MIETLIFILAIFSFLAGYSMAKFLDGDDKLYKQPRYIMKQNKTKEGE